MAFVSIPSVFLSCCSSSMLPWEEAFRNDHSTSTPESLLQLPSCFKKSPWIPAVRSCSPGLWPSIGLPLGPTACSSLLLFTFYHPAIRGLPVLGPATVVFVSVLLLECVSPLQTSEQCLSHVFPLKRSFLSEMAQYIKVLVT